MDKEGKTIEEKKNFTFEGERFVILVCEPGGWCDWEEECINLAKKELCNFLYIEKID